MIFLSSEEAKYLGEIFPSFMARQRFCDDKNQEIRLLETEFHVYNSNCIDSKLYMNMSINNKPYFYVSNRISLKDDDNQNYYKIILKEKKIIQQNLNNRNNYERDFKTNIFDCTKIDKSYQYSPFLPTGNFEENVLKIPFYPGMSIHYLILQQIQVTDTDKQTWAYELACAFLNLHQRGLYHSFFDSSAVFLTPNMIGNEKNPSNVHFNIILSNFSHNTNDENLKSMNMRKYYYRCPEFLINSTKSFSDLASFEKHQKNDVHAFGIFLMELLKWKTPESLFKAYARKERLELIIQGKTDVYFDSKLNEMKNPWISLINKCVDFDPLNRPNFEEIKNFLGDKQNFLKNVDMNEFEYRIKNVNIDTNCYFETLAYVNKKYQSFRIINTILTEIRNYMISKYSIKYDVNNDKPIVDQLFQILNSNLYFLKSLIKERKDFFHDLINNNYDEIIRNYTKEELLINLLKDLILNESNYQDEDDELKYQNYRDKLLRLANDLKSLSDVYYQDKIGVEPNIKDISFLFKQFGNSIPISEGQIRIIYKNLFNFNYTQTVEFLTILSQLKKINSNYFESLEKVYNILIKVFKNSDDPENCIDQIDNIFKLIYHTIYRNLSNQTQHFINNNGISFLINKIESIVHHLNEEDKTIIYSSLNILTKGLKIKESSNYVVLPFAGPVLDVILDAEQKRNERLLRKTIHISSISKSSLRTYLTRIIKNYKYSYKVKIKIVIDNDCIKQIKARDVSDILTKLGINDMRIESNSVSFIFNGLFWQ